MNGDRTQRVEELFHAALDRAGDERREYLVAACANDVELLREVESLLAASGDDGWLERQSFATDPNVGRRVGRYRLVEPIAHGGMGSVYRAERADGAYEQRVAIKLIAPDLTLGGRERSRELTRRFHAERQYLANLEHPHIAKLLDGGTTDDGAPYLVMELIDGLPIDRYCVEHELATRERLELFVSVCRAVQFIHSKLVAHRDLKPSNILVQRGASAGDVALPKLLDFGIAKLVEPDATELNTTRADARRLTPAYASPEQFKNEPVTTASDVYSLGVILYELLVGRSPYELERATPLDAARAVCERPPLRPSAIRRDLQSELETIVLRALEKDPARRYESAAALADDVERYLNGYPIQARPASAAYRFAKTVARHRLPFALAAALFVSIGALSVWLGLLYQRALASEKLATQRLQLAETARDDAVVSRDTAEKRRMQAETNAKLLQEVFASPDPFQRHGANVTVREVLDDVVARLDAELGDQPLIDSYLRGTIGWTLTSLGEAERAEPLLRTTCEVQEQLLGPNDPDTLRAMSNHSSALYALGRYDEARELNAVALERARKTLTPEDQLMYTLESNLALVLIRMGEFERARALFEESLAARRIAGAGEDRDALLVLRNYADLLREINEFAKAEAILRDVLKQLREHYPEDESAIAEGELGLGHTLESLGRYAEAEAAYRSAAEAFERLVGPSFPLAMTARSALAITLTRQGHHAEAEAMLRELLDQWRTTQGDDSFSAIVTESSLAITLQNDGRLDEAIELFRDVAERVERVFGAAHPMNEKSLFNLANALELAGKHDEAAAVRAKSDALAKTRSTAAQQQ